MSKPNVINLVERKQAKLKEQHMVEAEKRLDCVLSSLSEDIEARKRSIQRLIEHANSLDW